MIKTRPEDRGKTIVLVVLLIIVVGVIGVTLMSNLAGDAQTQAETTAQLEADIEEVKTTVKERSRVMELWREVHSPGANPFHVVGGAIEPPTAGGNPNAAGQPDPITGELPSIPVVLPPATLKGVLTGGPGSPANAALIEIGDELFEMREGDALYPDHIITRIEVSGLTINVDGDLSFVGLGEIYQPSPIIEGEIEPLPLAVF
jgi:hypothetical protein